MLYGWLHGAWGEHLLATGITQREILTASNEKGSYRKSKALFQPSRHLSHETGHWMGPPSSGLESSGKQQMAIDTANTQRFHNFHNLDDSEEDSAFIITGPSGPAPT